MRANPFESQLERLTRTLTEQFGVQVVCQGDNAWTDGSPILLLSVARPLDESLEKCLIGCFDHSHAPSLSVGRLAATMTVMLADAADIVGVLLLVAAVGGFLGILLRRRSGSGCGCSCGDLVCPPRRSEETAESPPEQMTDAAPADAGQASSDAPKSRPDRQP